MAERGGDYSGPSRKDTGKAKIGERRKRPDSDEDGQFKNPRIEDEKTTEEKIADAVELAAVAKLQQSAGLEEASGPDSRHELLFSVVLTEYDVENDVLRIDVKHALELFTSIEDPLPVNMFDAGKTKTYQVQLIKEKGMIGQSAYYDIYYITGGWSKFAKDHNLKTGEKVSIYKDGTRFILKHLPVYKLFSKRVTKIEELLDLDSDEAWKLMGPFKKSKTLSVYDDDGNRYLFELLSVKKEQNEERRAFWYSGSPGTPEYLSPHINEGWSEFVVNQQVRAGDEVAFYKRGTDYVVSVLKKPHDSIV